MSGSELALCSVRWGPPSGDLTQRQLSGRLVQPLREPRGHRGPRGLGGFRKLRVGVWHRSPHSGGASDPFSPQNCLNKQQLLTAIRQLQQVLKGQETRFAEGIRSMKSRLAALHSSVNRVGADAPPGGSRICAAGPARHAGPSPVRSPRTPTCPRLPLSGGRSLGLSLPRCPAGPICQPRPAGSTQ